MFGEEFHLQFSEGSVNVLQVSQTPADPQL